MTDPKNPLGGSTPDDFDALLDALGDEVAAPSEPAKPAKPAAPIYQPPPMPPMPAAVARSSEPAELSSIFDDAEDVPTRMVDVQQLKREAGEEISSARAARTGLDEVFQPKTKPVINLPRPDLSINDIPGVLDPQTTDSTVLTELDSLADLATIDEEGDRDTSPPPAHASAAAPSFAPPPLPPMSVVAEVDDSDPLLAPLDSPELASLVDGDPSADFGGPDGVMESSETLEVEEPSEEAQLDAGTDGAAELSLEGSEDDGPSLESDDGPEASFESSEESDGPVFETDSEEETISLEVGEEADVTISEERSSSDRGALLAATVTSRRRWLDEDESATPRDPKAEVEARIALLEGEADYADSPEQSAELLSVAGELVEGALGDRVRAKALYEKAYQFAPMSAFVLRALRRIALQESDVPRARELIEDERRLPLTASEREDLELFAAEVAAREGPAHAEDLWEQLIHSGGTRAALAHLFLGGSRHDASAMGDALGEIGQHATGGLAAAASLARARLAEGASEGDTALAAAQSAVQRDPNDVTSWLAVARIAVGRENAIAFREALDGFSRSSGTSALGWASTALQRATSGVLSDTMSPAAVPAAGVAAWLVTHALRDAGLDETVQVEAALSAAETDGQRNAWKGLAKGDGAGEESDVAKLFALRRAAAKDDPAELSSTAGALLHGETGDRAALESAIWAKKGSISAMEARPLDRDGVVQMPALASVVLSASAGIDVAEAKVPPSTEGAFERLANTERALRAGAATESVRATFEEMSSEDIHTGAKTFATRETGRLADDLAGAVAAIRNETNLSTDPIRTASLQFLSSAISAGLASEGAADEALEAARGLEGDVAAAELASLFGLRGEIPPPYISEVLGAAAGDSGNVASQISAVRAALRLAATEPETAGDALYRVWQKAKSDGALGALALRALPHEDVPRRSEILREMAERAQASSTPAALASWTLLAYTLSEANKPADAAKALARARTFALTDPALLAWEENLWLSAGMFAEVAERSFDALKSATSDEARISAYERLAELDSAFRNDVASAVLTYQAILELAPGHMASLRTLERYFLEQGRYDELLGIYDRLIRHVGDLDDAVAIAHAAARIAIKQAEGDHGAGTPFWGAAFARGNSDMRLVLALEAESRRSGDTRRFADILLRGETLAEDPFEKATFATRAAEALQNLGDRATALEALQRAVTACPTHPVALATLAIAREANDEHQAAAEAFESLAKSAKIPAHAVKYWLRAAVIWQDVLKDVERTRAALRETLAIEPAHPDAFGRSVRALKDQGDRQSELSVLDSRVAAGGPPQELLPLHLRIAELAEEIGDSTRARQSLKAALNFEPDRQDALRSLSRLARASADWTQAADAMIKLARLTQDQDERVEIMYSLGEIFDRHLSDPKRAEAAYKRVLQFSPGDARTLARLADLYGRSNDGPAEAETLRVLITSTPPGPVRRGLYIRLAAVLSEKLSEGKKAEEILESARKESPTDMDVLRAFARLYVRQEAPMALAVLLDRAAGEVRRQLDADLTGAPQLELLTDILKLRGRVDGARVVGAVALSLGVVSDKLSALSRDGVVPGAAASALTLEVLEMLAPPTVTTAHREMMRLSGDVLEKLLPFEPGAIRAEKLAARPHPMRAEIERWARIFGLESIEIYLGPPGPLLVTPIGRHPPAVMIPSDLKDSNVARFAIVRALAIVAMSLPLITRLSGQDVTAVLAGILRQFEPMFVAEGTDPAKVDDLARRITRTLPRPRHAELMPHAFEVIGGKATDGDAMAAGVVELANRVALLASGDVKGGLETLTPAGSTPRASVASTPALGRLVRVAISDRFLEARHLTGADKRTSIG